jgi:hypothetical protein
MFIASASQYANIEHAALAQENVIAAKTLETEETVVLAVLTSPIYLKSERDALKAQLKITLREKCDGKDFVVTFDNEVFRKIKDGLSEEEKEEIVTLAKKR